MREIMYLISLLKPQYKLMGITIFLGATTVGSNVGLIATSAYLISQAALHPELYVLNVAIVGVRFFGISRAIFRYAERYIAHDVTFRLLGILRVFCYQAMEGVAPVRFLRMRSGDLLSRIVSDVETLKFFYLKVLAPPLVALVVAAGVAIWLATYDWHLALLLISGFTVAGMVVPGFVYWLGNGNRQAEVAVRASFEAMLTDSIQGLTELAAFDQTKRYFSLLSSRGRDYSEQQCHSARGRTAGDALGYLVSQLTLLAGLCVTIPLVSGGILPGVSLAVVALGIQSAFEAVLPLPHFFYYLRESQAAAVRLIGLIDEAAETPDRKEAALVEPGKIVLEQVTFSYPGFEEPVLEKIDMIIEPGSKIAIVGASGSGKTTLVDLLLHFFECSEGKISCGGQDIRHWTMDSLRGVFGVISQKTHLFNATLEENILLARPTATPSELAAVIQSAKLKKLWSERQGAISQTGQDGQLLSGGERQRVAIARVLLKNAPVIICDEATNELDALTEQAILSELEGLFREKTVITITHNLAQLSQMDKIYVLANHKVVESGTQMELLKKQGLFYQMYRLQQEQLCDRNFMGSVESKEGKRNR